MFRFTIRDLLWLMVVVGLLCALWNANRRVDEVRANLDAVRLHALLMRGELISAKNQFEAEDKNQLVNWEFADQRIP